MVTVDQPLALPHAMVAQIVATSDRDRQALARSKAVERRISGLKPCGTTVTIAIFEIGWSFVSTSNFESEVGEVSAKLVANFRRSLEEIFDLLCWGNRQKHFPPKLHRDFHHQTSLRGSGLWRALLLYLWLSGLHKRGVC